LFVTVTEVAGLVAPTNTLPRATLDLERVAVAPSPVPVSGTLRALPVEMPTINAPVRVPGAVGVKVTVGVQLPPGGNAPQGFEATAKSPVAVAPVTVTVVVVLPLATVTAWAVLVCPTASFPKLTVASPVSETDCSALPSELSLTSSDPKVVPAKPGVKVKLIMQLEPAARVEDGPGQGELWTRKGLVTEMFETVRARLPLFASVTASGALVTPTVCPGKSRLPGDKLATGAWPVPLSETV